MPNAKHDLADALGHLRHAAHQLLAEPDPTGQALALASQILDIENLLEELDIEPAWVPAAETAAGSLATAGRLLGQRPDIVPSKIWPALQAILVEAGDRGHR